MHMCKVVRLYKNSYRKRTILTGLTLAEAQAYCRNPETSSSTAKSPSNVKRTKRLGPWFDSYEMEQ